MFSSLWARIKEFFSNMFGVNQKIEEALKVTPAVSDKMSEAIDEWTAMYMDEAEWLHEPTPEDKTRVVSLGLPAFIASEKARMAVLELKSEITAPTETKRIPNPKYYPPTSDEFGNVRASGETPTIVEETVKGDTRRADYLNKQYHEKLLSKIRTQLEYGTAKGSLIIKPYVVRSKVSGVAGIAEENQTADETEQYQYRMEYDFIQADCFYPFSFDSSQNITDVAFIQTITRGEYLYTRLERHKLEVNDVIIENYAFRSTVSSNQEVYGNIGGLTLGTAIPLTDVPEWKDIPQKAIVKNVDRLLFGYFKMPEANTIDPHSPLGVSCFGRAKNLIKDADEQYSRLLWEFEGGELAIDIDRDALQFMDNGKGGGQSVMSQLQNRLYRTIDLGESDTYRPFSPALRDVSLINGLNNILMRIEDVCALSRGTLSDVAAEARTATEIKILKQRSFSSNKEIQSALQKALEDVIYAMNVYVSLYNIVGDLKYDSNGKVDTSEMGSYDVSFEWDDSILVDEETELQTRLSLYSQGIESKLELRMWYFGETEKQAQEALNKITEENREAIEQNMVMSSQLGQQVRDGEGKIQNGEQEEKGQSPKQPIPNQNAQQTPQNTDTNNNTEQPKNT